MIRTLELLALLVGAVLGADQIFWPPRNHSAASPPQGADQIFWHPPNHSAASPPQGADQIFWHPPNHSAASPPQGADQIFWPPRNHSAASPPQVPWDRKFGPRASEEVILFAWPVSTPHLCELPPITGPCEAYMTKYYYNTTTATCESFTYGGCLGNQNKFHSAEQCEETCKSRSVVLPRA
ncbi:uncharacterized protein [Dermacentor andersoni]|uniref:uncharacterized protein isoform X2 n=1 Tax=Dermacentor andersoni TaxID=34620 RepID=UPI002417D430|nr:kunitz-type serine protease inhibitor 6-like [Dermacentor andersoni]